MSKQIISFSKLNATQMKAVKGGVALSAINWLCNINTASSPYWQNMCFTVDPEGPCDYIKGACTPNGACSPNQVVDVCMYL